MGQKTNRKASLTGASAFDSRRYQRGIRRERITAVPVISGQVPQPRQVADRFGLSKPFRKRETTDIEETRRVYNLHRPSSRSRRTLISITRTKRVILLNPVGPLDKSPMENVDGARTCS
ncbi:hypothetical protein KM043_012806 [Ampulex compressa]|nr:hypothetical protein KM043_012806 [Ampulex compressa]